MNDRQIDQALVERAQKGEQKATHNVKIYAEKRTKVGGGSGFVGQ